MKPHLMAAYAVPVLLSAALSRHIAPVVQAQARTAVEYTFKVIHIFPHDPNAFTQGLAYRDGFFYESTGLNGRSSLRKVRPDTGEVIQRLDLAPEFFGEGLALFKSEALQLTWKAETGFVYALNDFHLLRRFSYPGEGWGLAADDHELFMSDGSSELRVLDPYTFAEKRRIKVHDGEYPIMELNELEVVEGEIYANVWQTDRIARISPRTGEVTGWIDLTGILSPMYRREANAVLNGIAYDREHKRLFVTGKLWPSLFEIKAVRKPETGIAASTQLLYIERYEPGTMDRGRQLHQSAPCRVGCCAGRCD